MDELQRNARLHRIFSELEKHGMEAKDVLKELYLTRPEDILRDTRAMKLMSEWLSEKEFRTLVDTGELVIKSQLYSHRDYKITKGRHDLTQVIDDGRHTEDLCIHTENNRELPIGDSLLAKIIELKTDERAFLRKANARTVRAVGAAAEDYDGVFVAMSGTVVMQNLMAQTMANMTANYTGPYTQQPTAQFYGRPPVPVPQPYEYAHTGGNTSLEMLRMKMHSFTLEELGHVSTPPKLASIPEKLVNDCIRAAAAQALIDNIAATPAGLCVRGLIPSQDFIAPVCKHWRQPETGNYEIPVGASREGLGRMYEAYKSALLSTNDRKCIVIYGFSHLAVEPHCVHEIEVRRNHNTRIIDRIDVSHLHKVDAIALNTPMLFKRHDDFSIRFHLTDEAAGHHSRIQVLGGVAEPIGLTVAG